MEIKTADSILKETDELINNFNNSTLALNASSIAYTALMDDYNSRVLYDTSYLKQRMKETIMKVAIDEE